jgi:hypothetical protein
MKRMIFEENISSSREARPSTKLVALLPLLCVLAFVATTGHALTTDEKLVNRFVGKNWVNGRSWEKLDYAGKLGFVCGLFDGITLFWSASEAGKKTDIDSVYQALSVPSNMTVGDVVKGIDEFYGDSANLKLPAVCAYLYVAFKQRGDSNESMEKRLNLWRKMFSR